MPLLIGAQQQASNRVVTGHAARAPRRIAFPGGRGVRRSSPLVGARNRRPGRLSVLVGYPVVRRRASRSAGGSRRDAYFVILSSADGPSRDVANQLAHAAT